MDNTTLPANCSTPILIEALLTQNFHKIRMGRS